MSLTKLFNKNYLLENMKKSKGALILFSTLVPILSGIVLIANSSNNANSYRTGILSGTDVSIINILGMYVIPVILSIILFGYVYRKTSVDFINSMPINRKSIFITNTIGGIVLILMMQIITVIELLICSAVLKNIVIFPQVAISSFIVLTISYIFVFTVTNVAMSISGNSLVQIVVTALILFLIPFCDSVCKGVFFEADSRVEYAESIIAGEQVLNDMPINKIEDITYTTPYKMIAPTMFMIRGYDLKFYEITSIIKMIVLSIAYIILGKYLFEKRKMENNEESFANSYMHIIVKGLTLLPMIVIINAFWKSNVWVAMIPIVMMIIYYFIYDLLTRKRIKFIQSVAGLVVTVVVLQLVHLGVNTIYKPVYYRDISKDEVSCISIDMRSDNMYYSYYAGSSNEPILNYYMDNRELIDLIFEKGYGFSGLRFDTESETTEEPVYYDRDMYINLKMKNGKLIRTRVTLSNSSIIELIDILSKDDNYVNTIKNINIDDYIIEITGNIIDKDTSEELKREIKNELSKMSLLDYKNKIMDSRSDFVQLFGYKDNNIARVMIPIELNERIFKIVTDTCNKIAIERLKSGAKGMYYNFYTNSYNENYEYEEIDNLYVQNAYLAREKIYNFIIENAGTECNMNDRYISISGNPWNIKFFTNKVDELIEIIKTNRDEDAEPELYKKVL